MSQNTSSAVMQQRREPSDSFDYFPTPPWATRALCEHVLIPSDLRTLQCLEPACGEGYMARPLAEYFASVAACDVQDMGFGRVDDYLFPDPQRATVDWTITNPPFRLALQFIETALRTSRIGVAMLVRIAFVEGITRYEELFSKTPPSIIAQFVERVAMVRGKVDEEASSATAYCWMVWLKGRLQATKFQWIPPCRDKMERPGDYETTKFQESVG